MSAALTAENLSLSYGGSVVLDQVSVSVEMGEFFVVIGSNGAGKTSLLRCLAGLARPSAGTVTVLGKVLAGYSRRQLALVMAMVSQQAVTDFPFTVRETVLMGRSPHLGLLDREGAADRRLAEQAMVFTDVVELADRRLDQLSGGERQRVMLARAICQEPRIILLDEPTAALDPGHQVHFMDLMERLRRERGITVVMVSHDLNLAAMYAQRVLLLQKGRQVACGAPAEVFCRDLLAASYGCDFLVELAAGAVPRITPLPEKFGQSRKPS